MFPISFTFGALTVSQLLEEVEDSSGLLVVFALVLLHALFRGSSATLDD